MTAFTLIWLGAFGACVGSFLNVVIYRLPRQCKSIVRPGRSFCPHCRATIAWYDNIPLVSWLVLRAKCRHCGAPISARYTIVEALTAAMFVLVAWRFLDIYTRPLPEQWEWGLAICHLWLICGLIVASFIDIELTIIPDEITLTGLVVGPALAAAFPELYKSFAGYFPYGDIVSSPRTIALLGSLFGMGVGAGAIYLIRLFGHLIFRKEAMGLGDVKFMAFVGAILGWEGALLSIVLACFVGSIIGIGLRLLRGVRYVPFGPYLSVGALLTIFFREELIRFISEDYMKWFG